MHRLQSPFRLVLASLVLLAAVRAADAGPYDARVGETRAVYKKPSTVLREQPNAMGKPVSALASGTQVRVLEVQQPWLRVQAAQGTGWVMSGETVEPAALAANPAPVHTTAAAQAVNQRDVSAAGRQFDAATERGYRTSRADLQQGYAAVDAMEAATQALDPAESVGFIVGGALGRPGQDYRLPARLPPEPPKATRQPRQPRGGIGGLLGGIGERLGGDTGRRIGEAAGELAQGYVEGVQQLRTKFTPEQEYYLGRAVAANAIAKYGLDSSPTRRAYVRQVGDALVRLSTRVPANFGGYHFDVLNSDEVNAISGPGGFILITRGAVNACRSEDELAAVLAHELAHVTQQHGEQVIRASKAQQSNFEGFARAIGKGTGISEERWGAELVKLFSGSVSELVRTASEHSYGSAYEFGADLESTYILVDVVYDHHALLEQLRVLAARPGGNAASATHASPAMRAQQLQPTVDRYGPFRGSDRVKQVRVERINQALGR